MALDQCSIIKAATLLSMHGGNLILVLKLMFVTDL